MTHILRLANSFFRFAHKHLLWCLVACYCLGALLPGAGLWIRDSRLGPASMHGINPSLLSFMLGLLLFNAGLGLDQKHLSHLKRRLTVLTVATVTGVLVPLAYLIAVSFLLGFADVLIELPLLLGVAIIVAMPTAGSSTAWSQNADGNMAISLGLVLVSTLLSPLVAYGVLHFMHEVIVGQGGRGPTAFTSQMAATFLAIWVVVPAIVGFVVRKILGAARIEKLKNPIKLVNLINLLLLNYSNASLSLPSLIENPNTPLLLTSILVSLGLAVFCFGVAAPIASIFREQRAERASLFFGLGMRNVGAGMVLVSAVVPNPQIVLLPIILYNLIQHLGAAIVDRYIQVDESHGCK
ncbi:MAG: bile acid:sodium symporter [Pirellulales bacterium]|nr:bile acid:sodium symporter [Pirellulales bacterium]